MSKLIVTSFTPANNMKISHRREKRFLHERAVINSDLKNPITVRTYMTDRTVYVVVWIIYGLAGKTATGSAKWKIQDGDAYRNALCNALTSAGVRFNRAWDADGTEAPIKTLTEHLGHRKFIIHKSNP